MRLIRVVAASLIMCIAGAKFALAADWHFCIETADHDRKMYMADVGLMAASTALLERSFGRMLDRQGQLHDSIQCPTGANEQAVRAMRDYAETFSQRMGRAVEHIDWKPVAAISGNL
jgi:hypothetical protein